MDLWHVQTGRKVRSFRDMTDMPPDGDFARPYPVAVGFSSSGRHCFIASQTRLSISVWEIQASRRSITTKVWSGVGIIWQIHGS